jgi:hypothetical protein
MTHSTGDTPRCVVGCFGHREVIDAIAIGYRHSEGSGLDRLIMAMIVQIVEELH